MGTSIRQHCDELDRCNQRGGRMLSVFDLIEAGTLDMELAAFLMARIVSGDSFMVGARPGGAGKTTVMCALLNLLPAGIPIVAATAQAVRDAGRNTRGDRCCYVCHEIGAGPYFAYLWGEDLRAYCALAKRGHILATNLHADDLAQTRAQVCIENGVPEAHFNAFGLLVYLRMSGGWRSSRRWIEQVCVCDGTSRHLPVFDSGTGLRLEEVPGGVDETLLADCRQFVQETHKQGVRTVEATRERVLGFLETGAL